MNRKTWQVWLEDLQGEERGVLYQGNSKTQAMKIYKRNHKHQWYPLTVHIGTLIEGE